MDDSIRQYDQMERISITLDDDLKQELEMQVSKGDRARFVASAIRFALEEKKRQDALAYLLAFEAFPSHQDSSEILQEIRAARVQEVTDRSVL